MYDHQALVLANRWPAGRVTSTAAASVDPDHRRIRSLRTRRRLGTLLMTVGARLLQVSDHPPQHGLPQPGSVRLGRP